MALGAPQKQTLAEKPTENLAAYDAFLKGEEASQGLAVADPRDAPSRDRLLRAGGGARLDASCRPGRSSRGRTRAILQRGHAHPGRRRGRSRGERSTRDAGAGPARDPARAGRLLRSSSATDATRGDRGVRGGAQAGARQRRPAERRGRVEQSLGRWEAPPSCFTRAQRSTHARRSTRRRQGVAPALAAPLPRGARRPSTAACALAPASAAPSRPRP